MLRTLPPAPEGDGSKAAQELPEARRQMDEILAQVEADKEFRAALTADLEAALEAAGSRSSTRSSCPHCASG